MGLKKIVNEKTLLSSGNNGKWNFLLSARWLLRGVAYNGCNTYGWYGWVQFEKTIPPRSLEYPKCKLYEFQIILFFFVLTKWTETHDKRKQICIRSFSTSECHPK